MDLRWMASAVDEVEAPVLLPRDAGADEPHEVGPGHGSDLGLSGARILRGGKEAFAARVMLARSARHTLDVQYYIWHDDLSGSLLLDEIAAAARRGVRVRLLLDDNGIAGMDARLSALTGHANVEVRIFNPFKLRWPKALNWPFAFARLNRRMHAKSFTVDRRCTIIGGRNIGDEYFGAKSEGLFDDLDVMAVGPVVNEVRDAFDRHWHGKEAEPAERVLRGVSRGRARAAAERARVRVATPAAQEYRAEIGALPLVDDMRRGSVDLTWAPVRAVSCMPRFGEALRAGRNGLRDLMPTGLGTPERELIVVSGYFVPTLQGCADLEKLTRAGTRVRVLTNSYASTDVGLVHAGYAPWRQALIAGGVELFEMPAPHDRPKTAHKFIRPGSTRSRQRSGRSLHAKAYIVDRRRVYIGSANFDPRSAHLNTELGFIIESPAFAEAIAGHFERVIENSYKLTLADGGRLCWVDQRDDNPRPEGVEPGTNPGVRALIRVLSRLPIEHLL